jgi:hypothetical protein
VDWGVLVMKTLSKEFIEEKRTTLQVRDVKSELAKVVKFNWADAKKNPQPEKKVKQEDFSRVPNR